MMHGVNWYDFLARYYSFDVPVFPTQDPLAGKYPWLSPYAYCNNNPVNNIDPWGMDVYRYDDKTGAFTLYQKNDDKFDQVGKFKTVTNKETGEKSYELKTNKDGTAKTRMDNVEKGILSDGINFMKNDNVIAVGGKGQATTAGVENFVINLSEMVGKEIGGYEFSGKGDNQPSKVYISNYQMNTDQKAYSSFRYNIAGIKSPDEINIYTDFHTHLSRFPENAKLRPSGIDLPGGDMEHKRSQSIFGIKRFIILTKGYDPIPY